MTQLTGLAPGASVGLAKPTQVMDAPVTRVRSWLLYSVIHGGRPRQLLEYAPAAIVGRNDAGALVPEREEWAGEWRLALDRAEQLGNWLRAMPANPGIQRILGCERAANTVYLIAEDRADRASLGEEPLAPERMAAILDGLTAAMGVAHEADLLHLDIAPETALVGGEALVLRAFSPDERPLMRLTNDRFPYVRPPYSAMELYDETGRATLSPSTDIYAASALLYRLITGEDAPGWHQRSGAPGLAVRPEAKAYSAAFLAAIERGLSTDPADAFLSAEQWRQAMGTELLAQRPARRGGGKIFVVVAIVVAVALAGVAFALHIGPFGRSGPADADNGVVQVAPVVPTENGAGNAGSGMGGADTDDTAANGVTDNVDNSAVPEPLADNMVAAEPPQPDHHPAEPAPTTPLPVVVKPPHDAKPPVYHPPLHHPPVPQPQSKPLERKPTHDENCGYIGCTRSGSPERYER